MAEAAHQLHLRSKPTVLRMNLPPTFAVKWLIPHMDRSMREHPEIDLKVSPYAKQVNFEREAFDLAMRYGRDTPYVQ